MTYQDYCTKAGIPYKKDELRLEKSIAAPEGRALLRYEVPELTPDGTCSVGDTLASEPYDLRSILHIKTAAEERVCVSQLEALLGLLRTTQSQLRADWIGIYQTAFSHDGTPVLVKLVYEGKPSRAEFPLTKDFEPLSNNTKVGRSGQAIIIKDVATYEGAYYICDGQVMSEACLPIYDQSGRTVAGIIDAESFQANYFNDARVGLVANLCNALSRYLPI
jgi:putative methionine-R-sulfoxide reductase with GAF domain